ncbi:ROK family transcriptional regulator [Phytohabitans rumicis]|uniref:Transcriptional regulator n=1 Tax=Phytohabitans rumicis TaxID=1076125 RepID=A0A6V8LB59_9ACTN|nr:ROK family protein [Phytohabitans rumicis]GFJ92850.1 transcriptional regulator [Phytohabitans rumicis]
MLRRLNSAATLRALRGAGEPTLTELAQRTGLSRPTTEAVLAELAVRGLAEEVAPLVGQRLGRPARRYRFRAEAGLALGIEIDAHRTVLFLSDLDGRTVASHRAELDPAGARAERLAAVRAAVRACLREAGATHAELWAVAAGTPGVVDPEGRVTSCTVVPDWAGVDLARELGRSFACPVLVENDANLAAVAERWRGVAVDVDDVVYVLAGLHTGAGAIIGGQLRRGRWGAAGEVGVLPELGWRDTAAALAGRRGVDLEGAAAKVLAAADAGDAQARERVAALAARMARGVAALVLAMDPEMVVVGGALTLAGGALVEEVRRQVRPLCLSPTRIEASTLSDESVALGAVRLALDRIEADLLRTHSP